MSVCKRCGGSGTLLRSRPGTPVKKWFKKCADCGGHGSKPAPLKSREFIRMHKTKGIRAKSIIAAR